MQITYAELSLYPFHRREAILSAAFEWYLNRQMTLPLEDESASTDQHADQAASNQPT